MSGYDMRKGSWAAEGSAVSGEPGNPTPSPPGRPETSPLLGLVPGLRGALTSPFLILTSRMVGV